MPILKHNSLCTSDPVFMLLFKCESLILKIKIPLLMNLILPRNQIKLEKSWKGVTIVYFKAQFFMHEWEMTLVCSFIKKSFFFFGEYKKKIEKWNKKGVFGRTQIMLVEYLKIYLIVE